MPYTYSLPKSVSFTGKGLLGYSFGPLNQKDIDIYYIEVEKGHDTFMVSKRITRTYYVLSGRGYFTIDNIQQPVCAGVLVEVPPRVEYSYSGKMTLLGISIPGWFSGNDIFTKWNPDVLRSEFPCAADGRSSWNRLVKMRIFGKSPFNAFLRLNQSLWNRIPASVTNLSAIRLYGEGLHRLACVHGGRAQAFSTFFLRNRPELELIRRLVESRNTGDTLSVTVLGCSIGAEAYSVAWRIRSARPDLRLRLHGVDISRQAVDFAEKGIYSLTAPELANTAIFERMTEAEMGELFERTGEAMRVKSWIREGMTWLVGDAGDAETIERLGPQDLVIANNFLCHMEPAEAERCLRNIAHLVKRDGYLFVSGIDLDVRARVASDLRWKPLEELLEEIHEGDPGMRRFWPCHYGGVEPLNKRRADWKVRYASAFQVAHGRADEGQAAPKVVSSAEKPCSRGESVTGPNADSKKDLSTINLQ